MALNPGRIGGRITAALLVSVAGYYALWGGEYSAFDLYRLDRSQRAEAAFLAETRRQADSLAIVAERLENDPAAIEAVARERFGMIREGELLYRFVDADDLPEASAPEP
jgi:cell division protein FtsB